MEAIFVYQRNPYMMYLFEPLRSCTICMVYIIDGFSDHSWPPNSLKTSKMQFFLQFLANFCKFNFIIGLHIASGPQKGVLLGWFIRGQVDL